MYGNNEELSVVFYKETLEIMFSCGEVLIHKFWV